MSSNTTGASALGRFVARTVNVLEVARHGGLQIDVVRSPYSVVTHQPVFRLRHYFADSGDGKAPVLLVPPLMQIADVWDLSPSNSAVRMLHERGMDPWVIDFGDPGEEPGGSQRTFSDHVMAVSDALESIKRTTGRDVHLAGYSQGGLFCYIAAAYRACDAVASVIGLGPPLGGVPLEGLVPDKLLWDSAAVSGKLLRRTGMPRWAVKNMFNWMNPPQTIKSDLQYLMALHDRDSLLPREASRQFLKSGAWVGWSGPAIEELMGLLRRNALLEGGAVIGDRAVGLTDLTGPILIFVGEADTLAPPDSVRAIVRAAPRAEVYESVSPAGHFGLVVSGQAKKRTWPSVAAWVDWLSAGGSAAGLSAPDPLRRLRIEELQPAETPSVKPLAAGINAGLGLAAETLVYAPIGTLRIGQRAAGTIKELSVEIVQQLPRLARLERMGPGTRISYAAILHDRARAHGEETAFLFENRAHSNEAADQRVENVAKGLLSIGVRKGERVGVLMGPRPTALTTVAALNRIGAVAVLLRPGQDTAREIELSRVRRVIADPERCATLQDLPVTTFVLGGGAVERDLPEGMVDMEQIDPSDVSVPGWYRPNQGRARDLAFILFQGAGERTRVDEVTNGRWARSALGAASAASLGRMDTVYSVTPLHHASGLLLSTAASTVSGARLALGTHFDPETFWSEVRRYGITVVPYVWTMLHQLVRADEVPQEREHSVRLFIGSGMPSGLWRRVEERFAPASVVELYASTRTGAILGNVGGRKAGSVGRPLPGTPPVRVVQCDTRTGEVAVNALGYATVCDPNETGLLLVEATVNDVDRADGLLRGVFRPDDAWFATSDFFTVDGDGDHWYVDTVGAPIDTPHGAVSPRTVERTLGRFDPFDMAACYRAVDADGNARAVAAVTLRPGTDLESIMISRALGTLSPAECPDVVHGIESMPLTSWFRPDSGALAQAHPRADRIAESWRLDAASGQYRRWDER
ncbi:MAG TPA: alpha/beta fold hydrolase [Nocardioidaceae bacterium]|nr:alpha/beta fold hydrolase [Nocardioidaceae bacterium]